MKYGSIDIETLGLDPKTCDTIEFGCVLEDTSVQMALEELPRFHCYLTRPRNLYKGDVYAMFMHSKSGMFERIAKRTEGFSYIPFDLLDEVFADWLQEQGIEGKLTVAGKNFAGFDLQFLKEIGFGCRTELDHRTIDPGSMWFNPAEDESVPNLQICLERSGVRKGVAHTAVEDAIDVIRCIRAKHIGYQVQKLFSGFKVMERLQSDGPFEAGNFDTLELAEIYIAERKVAPLGTSSMFSIIHPNGEITKG